MKRMMRKAFNVLFFLLIITPVLFAGDRYALVVGIDKYPEKKLAGSVNDAEAVFAFFKKDKEFTEVRLLTDNEATRAGILAELRRFQAKIKDGDIFFFYFAGHGTVFPDRFSKDRDEGNRKIKGEIDLATRKPTFPEGTYDSAICPIDHKGKTSKEKWGNLILDDELSDEFAEFSAKGGGVLFVSDSCNSGTLGRKLDAPTTRFLTPSEAYDLPVTNEAVQQPARQTAPVNKKRDTLKNRFIAITAAADQQNAGELEDEKRKSWGIFTYYFLQILRENPGITFEELQKELDKRTGSENTSQKAQLETRFFPDAKQAKFFYPF